MFYKHRPEGCIIWAMVWVENCTIKYHDASKKGAKLCYLKDLGGKPNILVVTSRISGRGNIIGTVRPFVRPSVTDPGGGVLTRKTSSS